MQPIPPPPAEPEDDLQAYVGLAADEAERLAHERGWTVVRALEPGAVITMEYRFGRLNFEVREGAVHRSWKG
jgi:Peptidase inhibitor I78 family